MQYITLRFFLCYRLAGTVANVSVLMAVAERIRARITANYKFLKLQHLISYLCLISSFSRSIPKRLRSVQLCPRGIPLTNPALLVPASTSYRSPSKSADSPVQMRYYSPALSSRPSSTCTSSPSLPLRNTDTLLQSPCISPACLIL